MALTTVDQLLNDIKAGKDTSSGDDWKPLADLYLEKLRQARSNGGGGSAVGAAAASSSLVSPGSAGNSKSSFPTASPKSSNGSVRTLPLAGSPPATSKAAATESPKAAARTLRSSSVDLDHLEAETQRLAEEFGLVVAAASSGNVGTSLGSLQRQPPAVRAGYTSEPTKRNLWPHNATSERSDSSASLPRRGGSPAASSGGATQRLVSQLLPGGSGRQALEHFESDGLSSMGVAARQSRREPTDGSTPASPSSCASRSRQSNVPAPSEKLIASLAAVFSEAAGYAASLSGTERSRASKIVRSEEVVQIVSRAFRHFDASGAGCLPWRGGVMRDFVDEALREIGLRPPEEWQLYQAYTVFDADRSMQLTFDESLCFIKALCLALLGQYAAEDGRQDDSEVAQGESGEPQAWIAARTWLKSWSPPPLLPAAVVAYPGDLRIDSAELSPWLAAISLLNFNHRPRMVRAIETGDLLRLALEVFCTLDEQREGSFAWAGGGVQAFLVDVFKRCELLPPTEGQLYPVLKRFGAGAGGRLDAIGCLCLLDAICRVTFCGSGHEGHRTASSPSKLPRQQQQQQQAQKSQQQPQQQELTFVDLTSSDVCVSRGSGGQRLEAADGGAAAVAAPADVIGADNLQNPRQRVNIYAQPSDGSPGSKSSGSVQAAGGSPPAAANDEAPHATSQASASPPKSHHTALAERWVVNYAALPMAGTVSITYSSGIVIDFVAYQEAIESGDMMRASLQIYETVDTTGYLAWQDEEFHQFAEAVFKHHGLHPPSPAQVLPLCRKFDNRRNTMLNTSECLCLVDALLRAVFHIDISKPKAESSASTKKPRRADHETSPGSAGSPGRLESVIDMRSLAAHGGQSSVAQVRSDVSSPGGEEAAEARWQTNGFHLHAANPMAAAARPLGAPQEASFSSEADAPDLAQLFRDTAQLLDTSEGPANKEWMLEAVRAFRERAARERTTLVQAQKPEALQDAAMRLRRLLASIEGDGSSEPEKRISDVSVSDIPAPPQASDTIDEEAALNAAIDAASGARCLSAGTEVSAQSDDAGGAPRLAKPPKASSDVKRHVSFHPRDYGSSASVALSIIEIPEDGKDDSSESGASGSEAGVGHGRYVTNVYTTQESEVWHNGCDFDPSMLPNFG
eukprot:TRINITY_DN8832_c0_g1_i2.p1 TRINITY_DN8832_c0_g1~~TRINITY_DN8832_c0_g1_i2.p1  ORF type:complete len:1140 (-),score=297.99 TRINITY_DN8832_c0_g1_i2:148-3567(-)